MLPNLSRIVIVVLANLFVQEFLEMLVTMVQLAHFQESVLMVHLSGIAFCCSR